MNYEEYEKAMLKIALSNQWWKGFLTGIILTALGFGIAKEAFGESYHYDLRDKSAWSAFTQSGPVANLYGGTIPYNGGTMTLAQELTPPYSIHVDLWHRFMVAGTGGLRIGGLSLEWDSSGWQLVDRSVTDPVRLWRENQTTSWTGKRVQGTLSIEAHGVRYAESVSGSTEIHIVEVVHAVAPGQVTLWSSVAKPENAPRWLSLGVSIPDPTPTPTATETPTETPTEAPVVSATPTPFGSGWPWVWTLVVGPEGPTGAWFRAPTLYRADGTEYGGEIMPLSPWVGTAENKVYQWDGEAVLQKNE